VSPSRTGQGSERFRISELLSGDPARARASAPAVIVMLAPPARVARRADGSRVQSVGCMYY
jgi:hypothetical protein